MLRIMRFPPPLRYSLPLLVLFLGLLATLLEYDLNLRNDLSRHLDEVTASALATCGRLARLANGLQANAGTEILQNDITASSGEPWIQNVAVVDMNGKILAATKPEWRGQPVGETLLRQAAQLIGPEKQPASISSEDSSSVRCAYPYGSAESPSGWVVAEFDRLAALEDAKGDAWRQLGWSASSVGLACLVVWTLLHFGFAARLARLAASVRAFGEDQSHLPALVRGGDEVAEVSAAFVAMSERLRHREQEQLRLEREVLDASERERQRIGRDLHDGLGQHLTAASMASGALARSLATGQSPLAERAEGIAGQLRAAIAETRSLSHGLAPIELADEGFMAALGALADSIRGRTAVRCVFECPQPVRVANIDTATHLYRIAQEAVTNALKHADASEIRIGLGQRDGALILEVDDDGDGFEPEAVPPAATGIGLRVMRYRARLIGGDLVIGSPPAGGTRVACHIPFLS